MAPRYLTVLLVAVTLLSLPGSAWAGGGHGEWEQVVDGYHVELVIGETINPGSTPVQVILSDQGVPVAGALVQVGAVLKAATTADSHGAPEAEAHAAGETADGHAAAEDTHADAEADHADAADPHAGMDTDADHAEMPDAAHAAATAAPDRDAADEHGAADTDTHNEAAAGDHADAPGHTHATGMVFGLEPYAEAGAYGGSIILTEAGEWAVDVHFTIDGQAHVAEYPVQVVPVDRGGLVLAVFFGLNTAIVSSAAFLKRKPAVTAPTAGQE